MPASEKTPPIEGLDAARQAAAVLRDPVQFITRMFGDRLHQKQVDMCRSLVAHRRTSVVGANGTGKDYCVSRLICWWLTVMRPSIVVVLGPTYRQVSDVVWQNVREAHTRARDRGFLLDGKVLNTPRWTINDNWFATGIAVGQGAGKEFTLQGYHSPHLLAVVTEAHAVQDTHINALDRLNPERMILTGNPFVASGRFHATHHELRDRYSTIRISAFDTTNVQARRVILPGMVTWEDVEERRTLYGEDNPLYRSGVLCEWISGGQDSIIPLDWIIRATQRMMCPKCGEIIPEPRPLQRLHECKNYAPAPVIAVDVARFGDDKTVVVRRDGPNAQVIWRVQGKDTMEVAGWAAAYCRDNPNAAGTLVVDEVGLGAGVVDRLRESGVPGGWTLRPFMAGETAYAADRFANRGCETWWAMRDAFQDNKIAMPRDDALIAQLSGRRYKILGDSRLMLEGKDEMKKRGMSSPDEADALSMTFVLPSRGTGGKVEPGPFNAQRDLTRIGAGESVWASSHRW